MVKEALPTSGDSSLESTIRAVLDEVGGLALDGETLALHDDLYDAGLTSFASVEVMLSLEAALDFELPESALTRDTFQSIASLMEAVHDAVGSV